MGKLGDGWPLLKQLSAPQNSSKLSPLNRSRSQISSAFQHSLQISFSWPVQQRNCPKTGQPVHFWALSYGQVKCKAWPQIYSPRNVLIIMGKPKTSAFQPCKFPDLPTPTNALTYTSVNTHTHRETSPWSTCTQCLPWVQTRPRSPPRTCTHRSHSRWPMPRPLYPCLIGHPPMACLTWLLPHEAKTSPHLLPCLR